MITTEKSPELCIESGTYLQKDYITKYNPEEDISEPSPEDHPEDLSVADFDNDRNEPLGTCPDCNNDLKENTVGSASDPENVIDILVCPNCGWTDRTFFNYMTPEEVLDRIEAGEVEFV